MRLGYVHQGPPPAAAAAAAAADSASAGRDAASVRTGFGPGSGGCEVLPATTTTTTTSTAAPAKAKAKGNSPGTGALTPRGKKGTLVLVVIGIQTILGTSLPKASKRLRGRRSDLTSRAVSSAWCGNFGSVPLRTREYGIDANAVLPEQTNSVGWVLLLL